MQGLLAAKAQIIKKQASFMPCWHLLCWLNVASAHLRHLMAACSARAVHMLSRSYRKDAVASVQGSNEGHNCPCRMQ